MFLLSRNLRTSSSQRHTLFLSLTSTPAFDFPSLSHSHSPTFSSSAAAATQQSDKARSFTVSYLVKSCGLSPESAIVVSKKVQFQNPKKPDSFLAFLRAHGFSETQISNVIAKRPKCLLSDPEKTFVPKLEFFLSKGLSKKDLAKLISSYPPILYRSLNNHIVPTFDFFKRFFASDAFVVSLTMSNKETLGYNLDNVIPNIELFRELGFSDSNIGPVLLSFNDVMIVNHERLVEIVNKVKKMGFIPEKYTFLFALRMLSQRSFEDIWRRNYEVYARWGWSEEDILGAFRYHPNCMSISGEKIEKTMEFLVEEMGCPSKKISKCPVVLFYSLEKRIIPRCNVVKVLLSKGMIKPADFSFGTVLQCVEKEFLDKYVNKYVGKETLLLTVYRREVDPRDV